MSQDTGQLAPGLAQTASEVRAGLASSQRESAARQVQAKTFIRENGAGARQHTPVTGGQKTGA